MIPERVPPDLAPGGLVAIAFDTDGNEVTRSIVTPERIASVDWMATDAGGAVASRGGGNLVVYDGDTGEMMLNGPVIRYDDRLRAPVTHHVDALRIAQENVLTLNDDRWPWMVVGVFPVADTEGDPMAWFNWFCYTVGFHPLYELFCPCASIEGRGAGPELVTMFLNVIAAGVTLRLVEPGDSVVVPLGVPDGDDIDTLWWLGQMVDNTSHRYPTYQSPAPFVIPLLWSSGLGWQ